MDEFSTQPRNDSRKVSPTLAHSEQPPSYSSSQGLPCSSECSTSELSITAKSIPQWTWTNIQCRRWLSAFLHENYGRPQLGSTILAQEYDGIGPNLYLMSAGEWRAMVGKAHGDGIHATLLGFAAEAVPENVRATHSRFKTTGVNRDGFVRDDIKSATKDLKKREFWFKKP